MYRNQTEWMQAFVACDALYTHDNDPRRPHAVLVEGGHSATVFDGDKFTKQSWRLNEAASDLVDRLMTKGLDVNRVDCVVGPAMGGVPIAQAISMQISKRQTIPHCTWAYTEKRSRKGRKWMVFRRTSIRAGELVLLCDDIVTEGGTKERMLEAVLNAGGIPVPFLALLFNRSGEKEIRGLSITSLVHKQYPVWKADDCPLCRIGSKPMRVKGNNWNKFTATY